MKGGSKMKRLSILIVSIAFLFSIAKAQQYYTIQEIELQAEEGWHNRYEAYGREIDVAIDVKVPHVEKLPVIKVDLARMNASFTEEETGWHLIVRPEENVFAFETLKYPEEISEKIKKGPYEYFLKPREMDRVYPDGDSLTLANAIEVIKNKCEQVNLDISDFDLEYPYEMTTVSFYDVKTKQPSSGGEYRMFFHQNMYGIPVLCHDGYAYKDTPAYIEPPKIDACIVAEDEFLIGIEKMIETDLIEEDIPLCSFAKIIKEVEKEIESGHIRKVYGLELGYILYDDGDNKGTSKTYYAVPAWKLDCLYESNRKKELPNYNWKNINWDRYSNEYASIVINAQTGKMEDYMSKEKNRARYKKVLTWGEIHR